MQAAGAPPVQGKAILRMASFANVRKFAAADWASFDVEIAGQRIEPKLTAANVLAILKAGPI